MTAAMAMPGNTAETFLVHFFGTGLADDRYVVKRYRARADGDIVPAPAEALAAKGRRKTKRTVVSRKQAEAMRPDHTEIVICTGLSTRSGRQAWGSSMALGPSLRPQTEGLKALFGTSCWPAPVRSRRRAGVGGRRPDAHHPDIPIQHGGSTQDGLP